MLGAAQGGKEVSVYAQYRPAPTGVVFEFDSLVDFAELEQVAFNQIVVDNTTISLADPFNLHTVDTEGSLMYQDSYSGSVTGSCDGVREKLGIIAAAVNNEKANNQKFKWSAEVWGLRLALIPGDEGDNHRGIVGIRGDTDISGSFLSNVRYYSLGASGQGNYQTDCTQGSDGHTPDLATYRNAFKLVDQQVDIFNLLLLPKDSALDQKSLWGPASVFCQQRRAFLLIDPPEWRDIDAATQAQTGVSGLHAGLIRDYCAIFYPRVNINEDGIDLKISPCGTIAGLFTRIDATRGVWKAPAGTEADLRGISGLELQFSDDENGVLNKRAINTLRVFPNGIVNWGARTMDGDDDFGSEYKYISIRRLALFIEESLFRGLKWVVFEPNDDPLWVQIRLNVGAFMHDLFRNGAFQGQTPKDAYFVKCDAETTTQTDRKLGIVNIWVGFAPLKPSEFVILHLQQMAGQIQV